MIESELRMGAKGLHKLAMAAIHAAMPPDVKVRAM